MSEPSTIQAGLDAWMVESGEFPELHVGEVAELWLCARVWAMDGQGTVPDGATLPDRQRGSQRLHATVSWVGLHKRRLRLVVEHAGAPVAVEPVFAQRPRRRSPWMRLRGQEGIPVFVPMQFPEPAIGASVELDCHVSVMADYEIEGIWTGPVVAARYRVEHIDAVVFTPQNLLDGADEFDGFPEPPRRVVTGLDSTRKPLGLIRFDMTDDGRFRGEDVSSYSLVLRPVGSSGTTEA
jgi:hypothetical protein